MEILMLIFFLAPFFLLILLFTGKLSASRRYRPKIVKYSNDFEDIYSDLKQSFDEAIYHSWRKIKIQLIVIILFDVFLMIAAISIFKRNIWLSLLCLLLFIIVIFLLKYIVIKYNKVYNELFKEKIVIPYVNRIDYNLNYDKESGIPEELYRMFKFDKKKFNDFLFDDHIIGRLPTGRAIELSEVHIRKISEDSSQEIKHEIFWGICGWTELATPVKSRIELKKNKIKIIDRQDRVKMESNEFEENFDIYCNDPNEVKKIFEDDVMGFLVTFNVEFGINFEIIIEDSNMYFRFSSGKTFEPSIVSSERNKEMLWLHYSIYKFIAELNRIVSDELINDINR